MKKIFLLFYWLTLLFSGVAHAAWDATKPADNEYVYKVPGDIRSNWNAIATGTDPALCLTTAKICSGTQIPDTNLAQITDANVVDGSSLYSLSSTPSGAGAFPITNGGTGQTSRQAAIDALSALSLSGTSGEGLVSNGIDMVLGYPSTLTIPSMAQGDILFVNSTPAVTRLAAGTSGYVLSTNGASSNPSWVAAFSLPSQTGQSGNYLTTNGTSPSWVAITAHGSQLFTSSGTYTAPITGTVWVTMVGGGGGGGAGSTFAGGGGGGGESIERTPYSVTSTSTYTVTVGAAGGTASNGGNTSFGTGTVLTVDGGVGGGSGTGSVYGSGGNGGNSGSSTLNASGATAGNYFLTQKGGGGASPNSSGTNAGGASLYGSGGSGSGGNASGYGGGAGGGASGSGSPGTSTAGFVLVEW